MTLNYIIYGLENKKHIFIIIFKIYYLIYLLDD